MKKTIRNLAIYGTCVLAFYLLQNDVRQYDLSCEHYSEPQFTSCAIRKTNIFGTRAGSSGYVSEVQNISTQRDLFGHMRNALVGKDPIHETTNFAVDLWVKQENTDPVLERLQMYLTKPDGPSLALTYSEPRLPYLKWGLVTLMLTSWVAYFLVRKGRHRSSRV